MRGKRALADNGSAHQNGPLGRPRDWVLSVGSLIIFGILAYVIRGNVAPAAFAGALAVFIIAVIQRFRRTH